MRKRIVDINGRLIYTCAPGFFEALDAIKKMIDQMEAEQVDRADIIVVLKKLQDETSFHLVLLGDIKD